MIFKMGLKEKGLALEGRRFASTQGSETVLPPNAGLGLLVVQEPSS